MNIQIEDGAVINYSLGAEGANCEFGAGGIIRRGSVLYKGVRAGDFFQTGHNTMIRGETIIGDHVVIGTNTVIDGKVQIGSFVKIESNCYIPTHVKIGNRVFIGPGVVFTNDKYPLKMRKQYSEKGPQGALVKDFVTIGAGVIVCPGVVIGEGSFIAAGALVTKDIPPKCMAIGNPAKVFPLPKHLCEQNLALSWQEFL